MSNGWILFMEHDQVLYLEILGFPNAKESSLEIQDFENAEVTDFENAQVTDFQNALVMDLANVQVTSLEISDFENV